MDTEELLSSGYRNSGKAGNCTLACQIWMLKKAQESHEKILEAGLPAQDLANLIRQLSDQMHTAAEQLQLS